MELNNKQTSIIPEAFKKEVFDELMDFYNTVEFIQNLCDPNRKRAKDLERDNEGKIIVNLSKPHILEDTDYFRPAALHYQKFGCYTNLYPNSSPNSEYRRFWREEARRCRDGYVRESDGEWIPGPFYFYLNYSPIMRNVIVPGTKRAERKREFPDFYDGTYLYHHYLHQSKKSGKHSGLLKRRGIGFSYTAGSDLARLFILGESSFNCKDVTSFAIASEKEYLLKDGILNKFVANINWCASTTPWPRLKLKDSLNLMTWESGYVDENGLIKGTHNTVIGVTTQGNPEKARGKRGTIYWDEWGIFPNLLKSWNVARDSVEEGDYAHSTMIGGGCVCAGTKVWTNSGLLVNIEELNQSQGILGYNGNTISTEDITYWQSYTEKPCYRITTNTHRELECSDDHPILWSRQNYGDHIKTKFKKQTKFVRADNINIGDQVAVIEQVPLFGVKKMWEPRFIGWLIGDGTYGKDHSPRLSNCEDEINNYIETNFITHTTKQCLTKSNKIYKETVIKQICPTLRELGIYGQTKLDKTLPVDINTYSKETISELLGGLFDTDGCVEDRRISVASSSKTLLNEVRFLLHKFGIHGRIQIKNINKNNHKSKNIYYEFIISDKRSVLNFRNSIKLIPKYKQDRLNDIIKYFDSKSEKISKNNNGLRFERVIKIEYIGIKPVYNLTANNTHTYIANGIVTHNTGGTEGADFAGAEEMFYNADGYNILSVPNIYDKNANGKSRCAFFFPAYLNRLGHYDKDGNSDVIGALKEIIERRIHIKHNSTDPNTLVQNKAEMCVTPQEAIMRREGSIFPVPDLKDYMAEISLDVNKFTAPHYVGHLKTTTGGVIEWDQKEYHPVLRNFPLKDELDRCGAVEIFEMPRKLSDGSIPYWRYIAGIDPIDSDAGEYTNSLGSIFVFDTWTDRIVAEYSGRPQLASEFYDICLKLLRFYNAIANYENNIKGLFQYFDTNRALHYLCDTPLVLRDMDYVKGTAFGNRAKGTPASKQVNAWGRKLQADWLISQAYDPIGENTLDANGNIVEVVKPMNLQKIRSLGYLKELIAWNPDDNFDRVSAMGMAMILRADRAKFEQYKRDDKIKTITDDPWFNRFAGKPTNKIVNPAKSISIPDSLRYTPNSNSK